MIAWVLFGDRLMPVTRVELEPVVTLQKPVPVQSLQSLPSLTAEAAFSGSALFQASGWFEADPFPFRATALTSGIVETVHVLEGQAVVAGQPIATFIREDLELQLEAARANVVAARAAARETRSEHALAEARVASMQQEIEVALARRKELADLDARARELGPEVMAQQDIIQAELRLQTQDKAIKALEAQLKERLIEIERLSGKISVMESMLDQADVRFREAELAYVRTIIRSPVDGTIQRLTVSPGQKKVLMADNPESATVALIFQPGKLQARIDVPLADAARLRIGQAVLIESEFLPGEVLRGHVQRINGEADLQRNTLQAKVAIENPPAGLRPEILCRARFLDGTVAVADGDSRNPGNRAQASNAGGSLTFLLPQSALIDGNTGKPAAWVVDASGVRIQQRLLQLAGEAKDGYYPVIDGLRPGDRVVIRPSGKLRNGMRIQPEQIR